MTTGDVQTSAPATKPPQPSSADDLRYDWSREELAAIYNQPLTRLVRLASQVHSAHWPDDEVQWATLLSIKTGGCKEDCGYCPQSARYSTGVDAHGLLDLDTIRTAATAAREGGSSRFCMGAAWRSPPKTESEQFQRVLKAVKEVKSLGLEVCTTLGMLTAEQAEALAEAGVYAYNHNLDTSPEYYGDVISTRTYQDRLQTLANVRAAGMTVCCGGIIGMGEGEHDRIGLLAQLANMDPHPESVPINTLMKIEGTPLADSEDIDAFDMVRMIATARIAMPKSRVRISAGRTSMSDEAQALCFTAGANSIFTGDKLLTAENPDRDADTKLFDRLGLRVGRADESERPPTMLS